jgi:type III restriction enzyme
MENHVQAIKNRLSLRKPQSDSLQILEKLVNKLSLKKDVNLAEELKKVKELYPTCSEFERDFPSICFALATGVGKTRLMGAFISYLYLAKGVKNFFVLAPNLTIYEKLIDDLSNPQSPKYVFNGIAEFAVNPPRIITGDNYTEAKQASLFKETVNINIFNISKINSEVRGGREPRIKRLSEYLGESYFDYLANLPDLVLLMDESHHYRAAAGLNAINELKPILGLELTATPKYSTGGRHNINFKNVVYEYSLPMAMRDGFVKEPTVATRKNFNPLQYHNDPEALSLIKLEDGIRFHEDTKLALEIYSRDTDNRLVRPFVLVITKDTTHASEIKNLLESDRFFSGKYRGKVIEVHSNQTGEESDDNIQKLINLEKPDNTVEIVIHVNMLKEGWDVTNLYTIIPLRAANAEILIEQTIGRGLRLPYGVRTGIKKVDTLTIIAHDRFQAIVDAANLPGSIIKQENIIQIDPEEIPPNQEAVTVSSNLITALNNKQNQIDSISNDAQRKKENIALIATRAIIEVAQAINHDVKSINDLQNSEIKKIAIDKIIERVEAIPEQHLIKKEIMESVLKDYKSVIDDLIKNTIPIPRIIIQQSGGVTANYKDFDLDTKSLSYRTVSDELIRQTLRTNEREVVMGGTDNVIRDTPVNTIVKELINYATIEYDRHANLLYKLAEQAVKKLNTSSEDDLKNIVLYHKREIAGFIYAQMEKHFEVINNGFEKPIVYPFTKIEAHNYTKESADTIHNYTETIEPIRNIPIKIFGGFKKACHALYKFDSKAEKDFSIILENDPFVLRWLRPSLPQFMLYWDNNSRRYIPDFVVETEKTIYLVEIKASIQLHDAEVTEKADAARKYCETASLYNQQNGGKNWEYVMIAHDRVSSNMTFNSFIR